jgi:hypothetical protein
MTDLGHNSGATPHLDRAADLDALRGMTPDELRRVAEELGARRSPRSRIPADIWVPGSAWSSSPWRCITSSARRTTG